MNVIDFHAHFFPDKVAESAIPKMVASSGYPAWHDGTAAGLLDSMDRYGISAAVVLPVATNPDKVGSVNRFSAAVQNGRLCMLGALHPCSAGWRGELEEVLRLGFPGVKLHPEYQNFDPDDPALRPFFAALRDAGLLVYFHAGEDPAYRPPCRGCPESLAALYRELPGIRLVAAHLGGFRAWDRVREHLVGKDILMDTSFGLGFMSDAEALRLIRRHGTERVLFGTDSPWLDQGDEIEKVLRLGLSPAEEEAVFYRNALRLIPRLAGAVTAHGRPTFLTARFAMRVKQVSVFLENRAGRLDDVTEIIGREKINIRALSLADTSDFGILRLIVNQPEKAYEALQRAGFTTRFTEVVAVEVPDTPGGLASVLRIFREANLNVEYLYAFVEKRSEGAVVIFRVEEIDRAIGILQQKGVTLLTGQEVYQL